VMTIIDYGLGNIRAFANVYNKLNISVSIARTTEDVERASKLILPGVGSFDYAMRRLNESGMRGILDEVVLNRKVAILGICVGMQMLCCSSEEGELPGLGWIDAEVKKFELSSFAYPGCVPHMGWNDIRPLRRNSLFNGLDDNLQFYFLHSYYIHCNKNENSVAVADHEREFTCAINSENIFGVQFHPEKSHQWGIQLLKNFAEL